MELLIAIVILSGSVAVLGEMMRQSLRDARQVQNLVQAELLAESILARCRLGEIELLPVVDNPILGVEDTGAFDGDFPRWLYSLDIRTVEEGLLELVVTVRENRDDAKRPTTCTLVRWMLEEITE